MRTSTQKAKRGPHLPQRGSFCRVGSRTQLQHHFRQSASVARANDSASRGPAKLREERVRGSEGGISRCLSHHLIRAVDWVFDGRGAMQLGRQRQLRTDCLWSRFLKISCGPRVCCQQIALRMNHDKLPHPFEADRLVTTSRELPKNQGRGATFISDLLQRTTLTYS